VLAGKLHTTEVFLSRTLAEHQNRVPDQMARRAVHQDQAVLGLVGWAPHCRRLWDLCQKPTVRQN